MKWTYDARCDALYVQCEDVPTASTETVNDNVNVDLAADGTTIAGIEVLNAHTATFENLVVDAMTGAWLGDIIRAVRSTRCT